LTLSDPAIHVAFDSYLSRHSRRSQNLPLLFLLLFAPGACSNIPTAADCRAGTSVRDNAGSVCETPATLRLIDDFPALERTPLSGTKKETKSKNVENVYQHERARGPTFGGDRAHGFGVCRIEIRLYLDVRQRQRGRSRW
ncbi:hypothetical protein CI238_11830, partial [Colletotrichum incanum]